MLISIVISQCRNLQRSVKKLLCGALLAVLLLSGGPTLPSSSKPRLYTRLDRYFRSLEHCSIDPVHEKTLRALKATIAGSFSGTYDLVILFTCPDNAFRSVAAQIILESLVEIRHIPRLKVFSAGYNNKEIDLRLLKMTEAECADVRGALFTSELPFENPGLIGDERLLEKEFDIMATEIYYTVKEAATPKY